MKNRSERNSQYETPAMSIFKDKQLITKRLEGMTKEEYKFLRKLQTKILHSLFRKGHSPSRKLSGVISPHRPLISGAGFRKVRFQRKAS